MALKDPPPDVESAIRIKLYPESMKANSTTTQDFGIDRELHPEKRQASDHPTINMAAIAPS